MAIIDIGSNTIRLVIYRYNKITGLRELGNIKKVARLSMYVEEDGNLSEDGIEILSQILKDFKKIMDDYEVADIIATATAAIRQVENKLNIVNRMKAETGIAIDILSGEEEAYFGYLAVINSIDTPSAVTIDLGGGSTELTLYKGENIEKSVSLPFGTVTLKRQFVSGERISLEEKSALRKYVMNQFEQLNWIGDQNIPAIGIGGSARNIAQIQHHLVKFPIASIHQYEMTPKDLIELHQYLENCTDEQLKQLEGLSADRADIIEIALEVFIGLVTRVNAPKFQISNKGLREGLLIHRILQSNPNGFYKHDNFKENAKTINFKYGRSLEENQSLIWMVEKFYLECCRLNLLHYNDHYLELMKRAAYFYGIGEYINKENAHQHSFYLIVNEPIAGLSYSERIKIALLASYKNKDWFKKFSLPYTSVLSKSTLKELKALGAILKFIYSLNVSKRNIVQTLQLDMDENLIRLFITTDGDGTPEMYHAELQKKHIERVLKYPVEIEFDKRKKSNDNRLSFKYFTTKQEDY